MEKDAGRAERVGRNRGPVSSRARPPGHGCGPVRVVLEGMADEGATIVVTIAGQGGGPEAPGRYSILVAGGRLGEDAIGLKAHDLEAGLAEVILHYARRRWGLD